MSAHCHRCGTDMVYVGEYPMMECPVCELRKENEKLKFAFEKHAKHHHVNLHFGHFDNCDRPSCRDARSALGW